MLIWENMKNWDGEEWFLAAVSSLALSTLTLVLVSIFMAAFSDGKIDYCYIETRHDYGNPERYAVVGHRSWSTNKVIGHAATAEEAHALMQRICASPDYTVYSDVPTPAPMTWTAMSPDERMQLDRGVRR